MLLFPLELKSSNFRTQKKKKNAEIVSKVNIKDVLLGENMLKIFGFHIAKG